MAVEWDRGEMLTLWQADRECILNMLRSGYILVIFRGRIVSMEQKWASRVQNRVKIFSKHEKKSNIVSIQKKSCSRVHEMWILCLLGHDFFVWRQFIDNSWEFPGGNGMNFIWRH